MRTVGARLGMLAICRRLRPALRSAWLLTFHCITDDGDESVLCKFFHSIREYEFDLYIRAVNW